jgi:DNA-directed RNA polymerase specialized sigma24 family protein
MTITGRGMLDVDEYLLEGDFRNEECKDSFMWIYDRMPPKMKMVVDLSMTGSSVVEIAKLMKVSVNTVISHKQKAKKRLLKLF